MKYPDLWDWQLGEPDYIVKAPAFDVPATGVVNYLNADVELNFDEDKWVRAVQYIPGDPAVLHHLLTYVTAPKEDFDGGEGGRESVARRFLEGYAPGKIDAMTFPQDTGVYIPKGHKLSMQFHYTTNGKASVDETMIGLYSTTSRPSTNCLPSPYPVDLKSRPTREITKRRPNMFSRSLLWSIAYAPTCTFVATT